MRGLLLAAALALTAAAAPAFPAPEDRALALAALEDPVTERRAEAVVWLANHGAMDDAPLLFKRLREDESPFVRGYAERALWLLWSRSGDPAIDRLMGRGVEEMESGRLREAIATFSEVIRRKPGFAEGWNKRATAHYLAGHYRQSLADCDQVIQRNPQHFGALSGYGQIYSRLEQYDKALEYFRRALEVNPNLVGVEFGIKEIEQRLEERRKRAI
jgi:tetratricopeptide (TPR) repeat protein